MELARAIAAPEPLFADVPFWRDLREAAIPVLRTYPTIRVWAPNCGAGASALELALLLREEGLSQRSVVYGTDPDANLIEQARTGAPADVAGRLCFAVHDFATDASFNEFHMVFLRAGLGALSSDVVPRAFEVIRESLCRLGLLVLPDGDRPPEQDQSRYEPFGCPFLLRRIW